MTERNPLVECFKGVCEALSGSGVGSVVGGVVLQSPAAAASSMLACSDSASLNMSTDDLNDSSVLSASVGAGGGGALGDGKWFSTLDTMTKRVVLECLAGIAPQEFLLQAQVNSKGLQAYLAETSKGGAAVVVRDEGEEGMSTAAASGGSSRHRCESAQVKPLIEHALRFTLADIVTLMPSMRGIVFSPDLKSTQEEAMIGILLDIGIWLATESIGEASIIAYMLEDLFEIAELDKCRLLFRQICARVDSLIAIQKILAESRRGKLFLRSFNSLLRRLSKIEHAEFFGQVQMLISRIIPTFTTEQQSAREEPDPYGQCDADDHNGSPSDRFFNTFWALQSSLQTSQSPLTVENWEKISEQMSCVLSALQGHIQSTEESALASFIRVSHFKSSKAATLSSESGDSISISGRGSESNIMSDDHRGNEFEFSPRLLRSVKLLKYQMCDPVVQRQVLTQMVFFLSAAETSLKTLSPTDKQRVAVIDMKKRVIELLEQTKPDGHSYISTLMSIIAHEEPWLREAKAIEKPLAQAVSTIPPPSTSPAPATADAASVAAATASSLSIAVLSRNSSKLTKHDKPILGVVWPQMARLCSMSHKDATQIDTTVHIPSLADFTKPAEAQAKKEKEGEIIPDSENLSKDKLYNWRGLRLLAYTNLPAWRRVMAKHPSLTPATVPASSAASKEPSGTSSKESTSTTSTTAPSKTVLSVFLEELEESGVLPLSPVLSASTHSSSDKRRPDDIPRPTTPLEPERKRSRTAASAAAGDPQTPSSPLTPPSLAPTSAAPSSPTLAASANTAATTPQATHSTSKSTTPASPLLTPQQQP
ncbi:THO complex subunit 1 [Pelomyxa schiedti]|nr:THO complex subunit 1 [Pelomyxa schiedti]